MGNEWSNTCSNLLVQKDQEYREKPVSISTGREEPEPKIISDKIFKNRVEAEFPALPSHIQSKIEKLSKYQQNLTSLTPQQHKLSQNKIYRCKSPFNFIYLNLSDRPEPYPIGKCIIFKLKERDEFAGYFQGTLDQNFFISPHDCIIIFSNGCYFQGISQTQGRYTNLSTGLKYEGGWTNEMPDKNGKQKNNKGCYEGQYQIGEKQGKGKFTWNFGAVYEGNFAKGLLNGQGRLIDQNEDYEYEGELKKGEKHGKGLESTKTQKYTGDFCYGFRSGFGKLTVFKDDNKKELIKSYEGQFSENKPHGKGELTVYENGSEKDRIKGIWTRGKITAVLSYLLLE